jgi:hypothetical protein
MWVRSVRVATFVLVPGAGGDPWYWHAVVPHLRDAGHDAVAVELPAADDAAGLGDYVDAVVAAGAGRPEVVLVGQSMGGLSAPLAAPALDTRALVLLNAMIPARGESGGAWWEATGQPAAQRALALEQGRDPDAAFDPVEVFLHDLDPAMLAAALDRGGRPQSATPFATPWPGVPGTGRGLPDVPLRVVVGRHDRLFPAGFQHRLVRERLGDAAADAVVELAAGHCAALADPRATAAALLGAVPTAPRGG